MKLTQAEKNALYYAFENQISKRLLQASRDIHDHVVDSVLQDIDDIRDDIILYDKLSKERWGRYE